MRWSEVVRMGDIISFQEWRERKDEEKKRAALQVHIEQYCNFDHPDEIDALVVEGILQVENHTIFLAFLHQLDERQLSPRDVFTDVFNLTPKYYTAQYQLDWWQSIQHAITFLTILKENHRDEYVTFLFRR